MNDYAQLRSGLLLARDVPPAVSNVVFLSQTPGAPTNVQASVIGNTVNMSWSAPASGAAPNGYVVVARTIAGQLLATVPVGNVTTLGVAPPNGVYALSVRASNAVGDGPESASVTVTVPQAVAAPSAPTSYILSASAPGRGVIATVQLIGTSVTFPGVPGGTYDLRLTAVHAEGTGPVSNEVKVVVP
ncbi:MAG TPA: fibronectin type III domain-containing protein [Vicinamibacterales bacterium]|nr:fibronectin type III domain-containing protein [Vicinamibacterales bacterium]